MTTATKPRGLLKRWSLFDRLHPSHKEQAAQLREQYFVLGGDGLGPIAVIATAEGNRAVAQRMATAPRLIDALQRMLDEANDGGVSHQAKVEARAALAAARGTA